MWCRRLMQRASWRSVGVLGVVAGTSARWHLEARVAPQVVEEREQPPPTHKDLDVVLKSQTVRPAVYKIVLTGGPCGGKSTAVSLLTRRLQSLGFTIYIVPEAATLLFTAGARFDPTSIYTELAFEANKIRVQIALEDAFMDLAKSSTRPTVIICDRGTMDSRAYVGPEKWSIMLQENAWTVQALRDQRYDAVFHLVTTAIGAEEFYTNANNATRLEDATKARDLDLKILSAWVGHPKVQAVFIIDNSTDFDGKMNRVVTQICRLLGVPRPKQVDRKFLVESFHVPPEIISAKHFTETTYLSRPTSANSEQGYVFLRKRGETPDSAHNYFYSAKLVFPDGESAVVERQISGLEYSMLLSQVDPTKRVVRKKVRVFQHGNHYFELEQFLDGPQAGMMILKTSVDTSRETVELPPFVKVAREVTDDVKYSTFAIANKT